MRLILTFTIFFFVLAANAQDSLSRFAMTSSFYAGVPFYRSYQGELYVPDFEIGFNQTFSVRLKNRFFLMFGVGINHKEYRTEPEIRSNISYNYSPSVGYYNVQYSVEDFARQSYGEFTSVKVPLLVEYMPLGKWTPYLRGGMVFDALIRERQGEVYANTNQSLPYNELSYSDVDSPYLSLSALLGGGIKYTNGDVEFLMGVSTQVGLANFGSYAHSNNISLVGELGIRKTIGCSQFPHNKAINIDTTKLHKKNYLYVEGLGSVLWASLNYERNVYQFGKNRLHARLGFSADKSGSGIQAIVPVGLSYIYGRKHGAEVGAEYVHTFGNVYNYWAPHLGYRVEMNSNVLLRLNAVWQFYTNGQIFIVPGASLGFRF